MKSVSRPNRLGAPLHVGSASELDTIGECRQIGSKDLRIGNAGVPESSRIRESWRSRGAEAEASGGYPATSERHGQDSSARAHRSREYARSRRPVKYRSRPARRR